MRPSFSSLFVLAFLSTGCASIGLTQSLDPQVDEVRGLREEITAEWEAFGAQLEGVERDLVAFGNHRIDTAELDPAVVREAVATIEVPEEVNAGDVEGSREQVEARAAAYEQALENLDSDARDVLEEMRTSGAQLKQRLYVDLPTSLADITARTGGMAVQLAKIKGEAEQTAALAAKNPLMTNADERALEQGQAELDREMGALVDLTEQISAESRAYAERLSAVTAKFNLELSSLTGQR